MDEFKQGVVGAKSNNLAGLRGRLPESIQLPASVTVGATQGVLCLAENVSVRVGVLMAGALHH